MQTVFRTGAGVVLALALVLGTPTVAAAESPAQEFGIGAGTVAVNLVYMPVKFLYAIGGGIVAMGAFAFSGGDEEVARPIVDASLRGDYVITPGHLRGQDELEFVGRTPAQRHARDVASGGNSGGWGSAPVQDGPLEEGF